MSAVVLVRAVLNDLFRRSWTGFDHSPLYRRTRGKGSIGGWVGNSIALSAPVEL